MTILYNMSIEALSAAGQVSRPGARPHRSPPRNQDGDITCTHDDCKNEQPVFKRLCEYNKHMDKHERPYKCNNPACRKNPGFTYAGGLLRHQREVHSMHRTREPFFCPHSSCNRSTGTGFSRRENLEEHLRRRHSGINITGMGVGVDDNFTTSPTTTAGSSNDNTSTESRFMMKPPLPTLEPMPSSRKRRAADASSPLEAHDLAREAPSISRSSFPMPHAVHAQSNAEVQHLRTRVNVLEQDNDRLRNELFHRDQMLADLSQENKRLRSMLATLPPLPNHSSYGPPPPPPPPPHPQPHLPRHPPPPLG